MRIRNVENKAFIAQFIFRLGVHNLLKDSQLFLPKSDYKKRHGDFPRYFSGWYLFVPSRDLANDEIVHKKLNGIDLVAYRDSDGKAVIHSDTCPHMEGKFSGGLGKVIDGKLVCGYHQYRYDQGKPLSGPKSFRENPAKCIPCFQVEELHDLIFFWFDVNSANGTGQPAWLLDLPDVSHLERRAFTRSITPTHMAPLHENIVDDQHFMLLHEANRYKSEPQAYYEKHRFKTKNTMRVKLPSRLGPFKLPIKDDNLDMVMDSEFFGLGIHINTVKIRGHEATIIHCTTPIEDEITEWSLNVYMPKRQWKFKLDSQFFMNLAYPWGMLAQTYRLHTQDRRVFFEKGDYNFYQDAPQGFEKVNMFRRWIHEELLHEKRPMKENSIPTTFIATPRTQQPTKV